MEAACLPTSPVVSAFSDRVQQPPRPAQASCVRLQGLVSRTRSPDSAAASTRTTSPPQGPQRRTLSPCDDDKSPRQCLIDAGPYGGPLGPALLSKREQVFRLSGELVVGKTEQRWKLVEHEAGADTAAGRKPVARVRRSQGERRIIHVCAMDGAERVQVKDMSSSWNPLHVKLCFHVWRVGEEAGQAEQVPLFSIWRETIGLGPLGHREQWRIFRGSAKDEELYFVTATASRGWDWSFYKSRKDSKPVAHLSQLQGTGQDSKLTGAWIPAEFDLTVGPAEDAALLLTMSSVLDCVHSRSRRPS